MPTNTWRGEATIVIDGVAGATWLLPTDEPVTFGRAEGCGLRAARDWVSAELAVFEPVPQGWIVRNGARTRMRACSLWIEDGRFSPGAQALLHTGVWDLAWDLDHPCELRLRIIADTGYGERYRVVRNSNTRGNRIPARTNIAAHNLGLNATTRRRLAVLFEHLITESPPPRNLCAHAADRLGVTRRQVLNTALRTRDQLNQHRPAQIRTLEELGYYLVIVARVISEDDLP